MAKRKSRSEQPAADVGPKRRPGKAPLNLQIDERLRGAFDRFIASQKPQAKITAHLELALEEYLTARGYWPPK